MVKTKYAAGRVVPDAQPNTVNDKLVVVDDENHGGEVLRRSARKRPEKDVFGPSKQTPSSRHKPKKRRTIWNNSSSANKRV